MSCRWFGHAPEKIRGRHISEVLGAAAWEQLRAFVDRRKLISLGKGPDPKYLAIRALERIRDDSALALLTRLTEDPSEAVRLRAQRAKETLMAGMSGAPGTQTRTERRP